LLISVAAYLLSYFLPVFDANYEGSYMGFNMLIFGAFYFLYSILGWAIWAGNFVFLTLAVKMFFWPKSIGKLGVVLSMVPWVLGLFFVTLPIPLNEAGDMGKVEALLPGYYVWELALVVFSASAILCYLQNARNNNQITQENK